MTASVDPSFPTIRGSSVDKLQGGKFFGADWSNDTAQGHRLWTTEDYDRELTQQFRLGLGISAPPTTKLPRSIRTLRLREARKLGRHTPEQWARLLAACGHRCARCGGTEQVCKDHIVSLYQGGSDAIDNIQPLCHRCNSGKRAEAIDYRAANWRDYMVPS